MASITSKFGLPLRQTIRHCTSQMKYDGPVEKCVNSVQILGRVGQDPITRGENDNFVTFSMATSKTYAKKNMTGETDYNTRTQWHNITVFRPFLIERVQKQISKGTRVMVQGAIEYVDYTKPDGNRVLMTRIVPDDIFILSGTDHDAQTH
eukprot:TCONS_00068832-protein